MRRFAARTLGVALTTAAVGFAAGFAAGRHSRSAAGDPSEEKAIIGNPANLSAARDSMANGHPLSREVDEIFDARAAISPTETKVAIFDLLRRISRDDFGAAIALTAEHPRGRFYAPFIVGYWAEIDLAAARQWFDALAPQIQDQFASSMVESWAATDPRGALRWIEQLPDSRRAAVARNNAREIAVRIGPSEPDRVLALLNAVPASTASSSGSGNANTGVSRLFDVLAEKAPAEAAARALALPSGGMRMEAAYSVAKTWAARDPEAARKWSDQISDAALGAQIIAGCAVGMAEVDPRGAAEWMGTQPASVLNRRTMSQVMRRWGARDPSAALTWIDTLPKDSGADHLVGDVLEELARTDPTSAMQSILQRVADERPIGSPGSVGWEFARTKEPADALRVAAALDSRTGDSEIENIHDAIVSVAVSRDVQTSIRWAEQQSGEHRVRAFSAVANGFAAINSKRAAQWASDLPRDRIGDAARRAVGYRIQLEEPASAIALFNQMTDPEDVQTRKTETFRAWRRREPERAATWLEQSTAFTPEEKRELAPLPRTAP